MKRIKKKLQLKNIPKPNIHKTPSLKIRKLFSQHVERLREFTLNLCAYKSCALFKIIFNLSESHRKSAKRRTVPKIVDTHEARKKMGISSDLTRKLRHRKTLRSMRHHDHRKHEFIFQKFKSISCRDVKHKISFLICEY